MRLKVEIKINVFENTWTKYQSFLSGSFVILPNILGTKTYLFLKIMRVF